ncbi:MAG TPA: hypothetical protein PKC73_01140 [Dermatophilaceae bacterium]|jgi:hypothetical protein|nr:hypothetical protein [Candidatus Brachybacter algidus]MBK8748796.1 hypothetical protein [Candidatus Brachybacter algidus]HMT88214.1 hypothetical protein [Dermatophilaceae bacterium]
MLKRSITFKNLDGESITRDFYFNLSMPEVTELEFDMKGGMSAYWTDIVERKAAGELLRAYKDIVRRAFGVRDDDGITFNKSDEISRKFLQSDAYTVLFMEFFGPESSDTEFTNWLRAIVPPELVAKMPEALPVQENQAVGARTKPEGYSREELLNMDQVQFDTLAGTDPQKMSREVLMVAMQRKNSPRTDG